MPPMAFLVADRHRLLADSPEAHQPARIGEPTAQGDDLYPPAVEISVRCIAATAALSGVIWGAIGLVIWLLL